MVILESLTNPNFLLAIFCAIAVGATIITLAIPLLGNEELNRRKKTMVMEREKIRSRERSKLMSREDTRTSSLRQDDTKDIVRKIVEQFNLKNLFLKSDTRSKLMQAGYRSESTVYFYLLMRLIIPCAIFLIAVFYIFILKIFDHPLIIRLGIVAAVTAFGYYLPDLLLTSQRQKRQTILRRGWPDALDLMLICVESGMTIENAFRKVSEEMAVSAPELTEEVALTTAELSYLEKRTDAYDNLSMRTGLDGIKATTMALSQAEKYGTPIGQSLRIMAQESRDMRMAEAERKAASLPPKLTVPMIVFFLPAIFVIVLGPAGIQIADNF